LDNPVFQNEPFDLSAPKTWTGCQAKLTSPALKLLSWFYETIPHNSPTCRQYFWIGEGDPPRNNNTGFNGNI